MYTEEVDVEAGVEGMGPRQWWLIESMDDLSCHSVESDNHHLHKRSG